MDNKDSNRSGYFFLSSFEEALNCLDDEKEELALYRAITRYGLHEEEPEEFETSTLKLAWALIKPVLKKAWNNKRNGEKGGAPKGNQNRRPRAINNPSSTQIQPDNNSSSTKHIKDKGHRDKGHRDKGQEREQQGANAPAPSREFIEFQEWIGENAESVANMQWPFTEQQYNRIMQEWPPDEVYDVLEQMGNVFLRNNRSAYNTCVSWLKRRREEREG